MASDLSFVKFVAEQIQTAGELKYKSMFGDNGLFCDSKIIALICDNKLFVKPTAAGRSYIGNVTEVPPYPGAKPAFLIDDKIENSQWLSGLIKVSYGELPEPKPKKKSKKKNNK